MKKTLAVLAGILLASCGGDSPTATNHIDASTQGVVSSSSAQDPTPSPTPEPSEADLSGGKGVTASFDGLDATIVSTNTGHGNDGVVCYTDGFQGPNLPGTPVPWSVAAKGTTTVQFPKEKIAAGLSWGEEQCEQTIGVQGDVFRGPNCEGFILAVAWPQDNLVVFERPLLWTAMEKPEVEEGDWSECQEVRDDEAQTLADTLEADQTCQPEKCYGKQFRKVTYKYFEESPCAELRLVRTETKTEERKCEMECPYAEGFCFYNVSGRVKEATCRLKLGGQPLRLGEWGRWGDGPPSDHCRFTVPGIYSDHFQKFQLTPGQSDPRCNSY